MTKLVPTTPGYLKNLKIQAANGRLDLIIDGAEPFSLAVSGRGNACDRLIDAIRIARNAMIRGGSLEMHVCEIEHER